MAPKMLVAAHPDNKAFIEAAATVGVDVRVLDCFEEHHAKLQTMYQSLCIHVPAHRNAVKQAVSSEMFDVAVVHEIGNDFVKTALLTQTLREARVQNIFVVTQNVASIPLYRRCGAHQVFVRDSLLDAWSDVQNHLLLQVSAS